MDRFRNDLLRTIESTRGVYAGATVFDYKGSDTDLTYVKEFTGKDYRLSFMLIGTEIEKIDPAHGKVGRTDVQKYKPENGSDFPWGHGSWGHGIHKVDEGK